jgi:hypothetical protein
MRFREKRMPSNRTMTPLQPALLVAASAVALLVGLQACWDDDPCDPGQKADGLYCVPLPKDAAVPPPPVVIDDDAGGAGGASGEVDPAVAACAETVVASVPTACKNCICSVTEPATCQMNVAESVCNQACWDLISCTAANCPNFAQTMDIGCLSSNCGAYLAGAGGAMMAGPCVFPCDAECNP